VNIVLMATRLPDMFGRQVLRCAVCQLVQFRHENHYCVRCKQLLFTDEQTFQVGDTPAAPGPVVVEKLKTHNEFVRENVNKIRRMNDLSQRQLSEKVGSPRTWISKIENGKVDLTINSLERLAKALGVSIIDLISDNKSGAQCAIEQEILSDPFLVELAPFVKRLSKRDRYTFIAKLKSFASRKERGRLGIAA
jgi:transcriptional regulator with XRE-family HTH domain